MALDVNLRDVTGGTPVSMTTAGEIRVAPPADKSKFYVHFPHDDGSLDAFEKLRVSEPRNVFEYNFATLPSTSTTVWEVAAIASGTSTLTTQLYGTDLNTLVGTGTGYWVQTFAHTRYRAGISVMFRATFNFNELIPNVRSRVGMFTDSGAFPSIAGDGFYIEADGTAIALVRRYATTSVTGLEERTLQSSWNLDKMNGTGSSGVTLDWTKAQHFVVEYQWLGVGMLRFGFDCGAADGIVWCHEFVATNTITGPWCRTGSLPVRAEIITTSAASQPGKLTLINCVVQHEGAIEERTHRYFAATTGATLRTVGTATGLFPLMSVRATPSTAAAGQVGALTARARIRPVSVSISVITVGTGTTSIQVALLMLPTPNTGATFAVATAGSVTQTDIAATATTAVTGVIMHCWIIPNVVGTYTLDLSDYDDNINLIGHPAVHVTAPITGSSVLTLAAGTLTGTTTVAPAFAASLNWKEII
jgi:hypothetical protein